MTETQGTEHRKGQGEVGKSQPKVSEHFAALLSDLNMAVDDTQGIYSKWAQTYDEDLNENGYNYGTPILAARHFAKLFQEGERSNVKVLDVAAGTGVVGLELKKRGFSDIDAVDANQAMLDIAKSKQVYNRLICDLIGSNSLDIQDDTYDGAVATGCFSKSHVNQDCFHELTRIIKPGGYLLIQIISEVLETLVGFEEAMEQLEKENVWTIAKRERFPDWHPHKAGDGMRIICRIN
ncbi:unnamed protein product [Owenia fusiformis]|uniref:Uncharacterized protein n=1 Tax=Owenia fusiformis TaxID=6347 RepID=A0A8J1TI04_OWEFU|nr:unnamed protein product [Owenia fusiformis]